MHIKHIHELMEKLSESACYELCNGIENVDTCEMGAVVDMIKDLADAEYHARIAKEMEKAEEEDEDVTMMIGVILPEDSLRKAVEEECLKSVPIGI